MHAHEHKAAVAEALGLNKPTHAPFPTTRYRQPKRDEQGHFILPLISRIVQTPEELDALDADIWRESPAAWDEGYVPFNQEQTQAEALAASRLQQADLVDENARLRALLAELRASGQSSDADVADETKSIDEAFEPTPKPKGKGKGK